MENATKALLIAAGVLMGMLILSLGVYLYYSLGSYVSTTQEQMESNALNKFNNQFLKYNNIQMIGNTEVEAFEIDFQDVITAANIAYENNTKYNLTSSDANENTYYVKVNAQINGESKMTSLEVNVAEQSANWLTNNNEKKYICKSSDIKMSKVTGRIYEINFHVKP